MKDIGKTVYFLMALESLICSKD